MSADYTHPEEYLYDIGIKANAVRDAANALAKAIDEYRADFPQARAASHGRDRWHYEARRMAKDATIIANAANAAADIVGGR
jgi:hypothetical protein